MLFARALVAFLACPGIVAYLFPLLLARFEPVGGWLGLLGLAFVLAGTVLLLWCVREFYVAGKGTLAPWAPPRHLVTGGPYRLSRNPMYVTVLVILLGWSTSFQSYVLLVYALALMVAFQLRIVLGEEPWLARMHGNQWQAYAARVPRWLF